MQQLLARYLLQHHYVVLPGMGTLRLVLSPAEHHDTVIIAPQYLFALRADEALLNEQLQSLTGSTQQSASQLHHALDHYVQQLKANAQQADVLWPGVGTWTHNSGHYSLHAPHFLAKPASTPTDTVSITTENEVAVLEDAAVVNAKKSAPLWPAWAALVLLLLGIAGYFIFKGGRWAHTGSQYGSGWVTPVSTHAVS